MTYDVINMRDRDVEWLLGRKDAEIERLKEENKVTVAICNENTDLKKLVTDLAAAVEDLEPDGFQYGDLVKLARDRGYLLP